MTRPREALRRTAGDLRRYVETLLEQGETTWLADSVPGPGSPAQPQPGGRKPIPAPVAAPVGAAGTPLVALAQVVSECRRCALGGQRQQAVFGEGDPNADLVFIGEAPGAEEDKVGRPFVGAAGQLLTKIIASIGLDRERVYICNVLKCRPPGNRNPLPEEITACREHLNAQLHALHPKVICALGTFAAQTLLSSQEPIGHLRGRVHAYEGVPVVPTFHPAALLYHPQNKKLVWEDMKLIAKMLGLPVGKS